MEVFVELDQGTRRVGLVFFCATKTQNLRGLEFRLRKNGNGFVAGGVLSEVSE